MKRRAFLAAATGAVRPAEYGISHQVLIPASPSEEWFPHVSGPRIEAVGEGAWLLARSRRNLWLFAGTKRINLGVFERARICSGPDGGAHVACTRADELWHLRISNRLKVAERRIASRLSLHPAAGVDIAWTRRGVVIAAPGPEPASLALYSPAGPPVVLATRRPSHPLLRYDPSRDRLKLVFSGWNDSSSFYDVICFVETADGGRTWQCADGSLFAPPYDFRFPGVEPDVLSRRQQNSGGESNTLAHGLQLDAGGQPHVLYSFCMPYSLGVGPPDTPWMRTKHVRWTGTGWTANELTRGREVDIAGGSLAIAGSSLYAIVMFKNTGAHWLDLGITHSSDGGATWAPITAVTSHAGATEAHLVAPAVISLGRRLEYVCTAQSVRKDVPVYAGTVAI